MPSDFQRETRRALPKLVAIVGPTASGKTALSLALAREWNGEIVNADSRQVYRGMDVATAKEPNEAESARESSEPAMYVVHGVRHHLIDILDPDERFTLADFQQRAIAAIREIHARGCVPFLVGGTGLYVAAIVDNLCIPSAPPDAALRRALEQQSTDALVSQLRMQDPETAQTIDAHNRRRLIRALEIVSATGASASARQRGESIFETCMLGISIPRDALYARINARVDAMIANGLVEETCQLREQYGVDLPAMSSIGYREINAFFEGKNSLSQAIEQIKQHTRNFARRQLTWWRRDSRVQWVSGMDEARALVQNFLKNNSLLYEKD